MLWAECCHSPSEIVSKGFHKCKFYTVNSFTSVYYRKLNSNNFVTKYLVSTFKG